MCCATFKAQPSKNDTRCTWDIGFKQCKLSAPSCPEGGVTRGQTFTLDSKGVVTFFHGGHSGGGGEEVLVEAEDGWRGRP